MNGKIPANPEVTVLAEPTESPSQQPPSGVRGFDPQILWRIGGVAGLVAIIVVVILWNTGKRRTPGDRGSDATESGSTGPLSSGANVAATVDELAQPWAAKKFTYVKPYTKEKVGAMVVRLPSGEYWAFSLQEPFGGCELELVTHLDRLASQYRYHTDHPLIVSSCNGTLYDPLKVGSFGSGTFARGEIVRGTGLRPPLSIEVQVSGKFIIASRSE